MTSRTLIRWNWPEIKRRWQPYIDQLPEYAYLCDELLSGRK